MRQVNLEFFRHVIATIEGIEKVKRGRAEVKAITTPSLPPFLFLLIRLSLNREPPVPLPASKFPMRSDLSQRKFDLKMTDGRSPARGDRE